MSADVSPVATITYKTTLCNSAVSIPRSVISTGQSHSGVRLSIVIGDASIRSIRCTTMGFLGSGYRKCRSSGIFISFIEESGLFSAKEIYVARRNSTIRL